MSELKLQLSDGVGTFDAGAVTPAVGIKTGFEVKQHQFADGVLPIPVGWRLLVMPIEVDEVSSGGIIMAEETKNAQKYNRYVGKVMAVGPDAYEHNKFPGDPWCAVGDWICYNQYTGLEAHVRDVNGETVALRFVNDDAVLGKAQDPKALLIRV